MSVYEEERGVTLLRVCPDGRAWWLKGTGVEVRRFYSEESKYHDLEGHWSLQALLSIDVEEELPGKEMATIEAGSVTAEKWTDWLEYWGLMSGHFENRAEAAGAAVPLAREASAFDPTNNLGTAGVANLS